MRVQKCLCGVPVCMQFLEFVLKVTLHDACYDLTKYHEIYITRAHYILHTIYMVHAWKSVVHISLLLRKKRCLHDGARYDDINDNDDNDEIDI